MKVFLLLPVLLLSETYAATVKLGSFDSKRNLIQKSETEVDKNEEYELQVYLTNKVAYISILGTDFDSVCTWSYEGVNKTTIITNGVVQTKQEVVFLRNLEFCDYKIRLAKTNSITMATPIANIPEFKKEGAILKVSCKTGSK